jgi:predicted dehydrogenase
VIAICSRDPERARARRDAHFPVARVTDDFDALLRDPAIRVLDLTAHPDVRLDLMKRALNAGKHVLSQKPFVDNLDDGRELVELAARRGLKLAVNQNGRWAPHLAYIREAVRAGLIGEVTGVHIEIRWNHGWIAGTSFEAMEDLILWDFGVHWFDFLASVIGGCARSVYATAVRAAGQTARPPLLAQALIGFDNGQASLVFDGATRFGARDATSVVGSNGVAFAQGRDLGHQAVELHTEAGVARPKLTGAWFNDGFAGAMGELLCAIEEGREPLNSARGNLLSLKLCQGALGSVRTGAPVAV